MQPSEDRTTKKMPKNVDIVIEIHHYHMNMNGLVVHADST